MLIIRYLKKEKKSSSEKNKNEKKVNAQVSKIKMALNVMLQVNGT